MNGKTKKQEPNADKCDDNKMSILLGGSGCEYMCIHMYVLIFQSQVPVDQIKDLFLNYAQAFFGGLGHGRMDELFDINKLLPRSSKIGVGYIFFVSIWFLTFLTFSNQIYSIGQVCKNKSNLRSQFQLVQRNNHNNNTDLSRSQHVCTPSCI